jgi:hypothetical protein
MSESGDKLKALSDYAVLNHLEDIFQYFDVELTRGNKLMYGSCAVHPSDSRTGFNLYPYGDYIRGNWKCRTKNCHNIFGGNFVGLIKGLLSRKEYGWGKEGDRQASLDEARIFLEEISGQKLDNIKINRSDLEKKKFAHITNIFTPIQHPKTNITREQVRKSLITPSAYFLKRGFTKLILEEYCIGECLTKGKEMVGRAVIPIFDESGKYLVSCLGRSLNDKCSKCQCYHVGNCPKEDYRWMYSKWRNSKTLKVEETLFNYWQALPYIKEKKCVNLVESAGNVLRLVESGIKNTVACLSTNLSPLQQHLIDSSGALNVNILMDNDLAGKTAAPILTEQLSRLYTTNIYFPSANDYADMTVEQVRKEFSHLL